MSLLRDSSYGLWYAALFDVSKGKYPHKRPVVGFHHQKLLVLHITLVMLQPSEQPRIEGLQSATLDKSFSPNGLQFSVPPCSRE